jgi:hypothetical protein
MTDQSTFHLGYLIGIPILFVLAMVALTAFAFTLVYWRRNRGDSYSDWGLGAFLSGLASVAFVGLTVGSLFPFDMSYHKYYRVTGTVEQINHRLIADGKSMSDRYVFVIGSKPYAVDDTRATLAKVGDAVTLWCSKEYQYQGDSGWACEWGVPS